MIPFDSYLYFNWHYERTSAPQSLQYTFKHTESTPLGALEGNCVGKAAFSYVMGGAMGLVMAMFMNAVEMREIEIGKVRRSTAIVLRKDWRKMKGTGKGFATFGGIFVLFECMIEHVRGKEDGLNSFLSGFGTSVVLSGNCTCVMR